MTYLIKRDDALAALTLGDTMTVLQNRISDIPAIDIATIREDALREAAAECQTVLETAKLYGIPPMAMGAATCREAILALIGEKK